MRVKKPQATFAPHELRRFILPITLAFICITAVVLLEHILTNTRLDAMLILYGISAILYALINNVLLIRTHDYQETYGLANSIFSGLWLGLFTYMAPVGIQETAHILILLGIIAVAIASGRFYSYLTMVITLAVSTSLAIGGVRSMGDFFDWAGPYIVGIVAIEAVIRIKDTTQQEIHRLETINNISRQIMLSLETEQTISILNESMQEALEGDTYYVGTVTGDEIHLHLLYDDGEYYNHTKIPLEAELAIRRPVTRMWLRALMSNSPRQPTGRLMPVPSTVTL